MDLYSQALPPAMHDYMRDGLPNLRHGAVGEHPLETRIRRLTAAKQNEEFKETAALFGLGFAKQLRNQRRLMERAGPPFGRDLGVELQTGDIDDIDFEDMFDGNDTTVAAQLDPHEMQESRFFE